jgi:hypothetical protein
MRELDTHEYTNVAGGFLPALALVGAVAAWAFANRADLIEIGQAASKKNDQLTSEH